MKRFILLLCVTLLFAGCEKEPTDYSFPIDKSDFTIGYEGEEITINFDLLPSMQTDVQIYIIQQNGSGNWIELVANNATSATFIVHRNLQHIERYAQIRIKNKSYSEYATINVKQEWFGAEFAEIEITETTTATYSAKVTAKDKDMCFAVFTKVLYDNQEDLEYLFDDASKIPANCGNSIESYANKNGLDLKQCMIDSGCCGTGSLDYSAQLLQQDSRYCIIVIGVEFHTDNNGSQYFTATTPVVRKYFKTEPMEMRDDLFDATVTIDEQYGSDILLSVDCSEESDLIYRYILYDVDRHAPFIFEEHTPKEFYDYFANLWYEEYTHELRFGPEDLETYMQSLELFTSSFADKRIRLNANHEYRLVVYAFGIVDDSIQIVSDIEVISIATTQPPLSDIDFDCNINSLKARSVNCTITPSLDSDGYYAVVMSKEEYESWDEELLHQRLVDEGTENGIYFGPQEIEAYTSPESDYYILCVGAHGGVATTEDITKFEFTTPSQPEAKCKITGVEIIGPYHPRTLIDYDREKYLQYFTNWFDYDMNNYCAVAINLHYEGECKNVYHRLFANNEVAGLNDEQIISILRDRRSLSKTLFYAKKDVTFRYYAMVEDEDGNIDFYVSPDEYYFTSEDYLTSEEDVAALAALYDDFLALKKEEEEKNSASSATSATRALQPEELCIDLY